MKLAKVIIILCVVAFFTFPVIVMFLLAPDSNKDKDDTGCTVSGGNVSANGIDKFNENAKGGKLEGKGKEIQKIAEKNKVPVNILWLLLRVNRNGVKEKMRQDKIILCLLWVQNRFMIQHIQLLKTVLMRELKICMMFIFLKV